MADRSADRHRQHPITYRAPKDTRGWLEDIAKREGRTVRAIVGDAVERARMISEADLAALDREETRRLAAWFRARSEGRDGREEHAAWEAANAACRHAISQWQPSGTRHGDLIDRSGTPESPQAH